MWAQRIERGTSELTEVMKTQILQLVLNGDNMYVLQCEKCLHFIARKLYLKRNSTLPSKSLTGRHGPLTSSLVIRFF